MKVFSKQCKIFSLQNMFSTSKESLYDRVPSVYDLKKDLSDKKNVNEVPEKNKQKESQQKSILESAKDILRLYKNPVFVLICVCMATYVLIFIPIMTSIVDYSKDKGLPETVGKYLIHAMAVGDILGKLILHTFIHVCQYYAIIL